MEKIFIDITVTWDNCPVEHPQYKGNHETKDNICKKRVSWNIDKQKFMSEDKSRPIDEWFDELLLRVRCTLNKENIKRIYSL